MVILHQFPIRHMGNTVYPSISHYIDSKGIAIQLWFEHHEDNDGSTLHFWEPYARATVNIPDDAETYGERAPNRVFIKDWSENAGILEALYKAGIIKGINDEDANGDPDLILETGYATCGWEMAPLVELTDEFMAHVPPVPE